MHWYGSGDWYLETVAFNTQSCCDFLTIYNDHYYSGSGSKLARDRPMLFGDITWSSDHSNTGNGFKICARERTEVYWNVDGPCSFVAGQPHCVTSPNWPNNYNNNEACTMSVPNQGQMYLRTESFGTEQTHDRLTINGNSYSGSGSNLVGHVIPFSGAITWRSDHLNTFPGWKICAYSSPSAISLAAGEPAGIAAAEVANEDERETTADMKATATSKNGEPAEVVALETMITRAKIGVAPSNKTKVSANVVDATTSTTFTTTTTLSTTTQTETMLV